MKRREFSVTAAGVAALSLGGVGMNALAQGRPVAGTHYQLVEPRAPIEAPTGKVEVVEFFWYNCPHCSSFEPALSAWLKRLPKDVAFRRIPIAFNDSFVPQQRLYFALEAMGLVETLHPKVFVAIHGQRLNLNRGDVIADWVGKQGVDKAKFMDQYNAFSTATKANRATQLQNAYRLEGVPALGVGGRFLTDGPMAGNMERALQVVDTLVSDLRSGRA